jgi:hypothetical protein
MRTESQTTDSELQQAAERAARGLDAEEAWAAALEVDRIREENRRRFGEQAVGVGIIRAFRGPLPG